MLPRNDTFVLSNPVKSYNFAKEPISAYSKIMLQKGLHNCAFDSKRIDATRETTTPNAASLKGLRPSNTAPVSRFFSKYYYLQFYFKSRYSQT